MRAFSLLVIIFSGTCLAAGPVDDHAHHHMNIKADNSDNNQYAVTHHEYHAPDLLLIDMNGDPVNLNSSFSSDYPVLLNFIFTSCTTICPIMTSTFSQVQEMLSTSGTTYKIISISIDPERDTPERLKKYAHKFQAGPEWSFITGDSARIKLVQRAFDAYRGNKMNHIPITFIKPSASQPWTRIEGFTSASEILSELRHLSSL